MPDYLIRWSKLARKELVPSKTSNRVVERVDRLALIPRFSGSLKLKGSSYWRIRIGDYRLLYAIDDAAKFVSILYIRHRKDVYRDIRAT